MSNDDLSAKIKDLVASYSALVKNATSKQSKRAGFASIQDYVTATRCKTETIDTSRIEYYSHALNKLMEVDHRLDAFPPTEFISTHNMNSSVVDIGAGPVLLIDLHQGEMLEEMGRLFLNRGPPQECGATALRILAEHFFASGKQELATYVSVRRSILVNESKPQKLAIVDNTEADRCGAVQEVFLLTHEIGHILWSQNRAPKDFAVSAAQWITTDTALMATVPRDLSRDKTAYALDQIQATLDRRCDPSSGFIEEVWADFYAWTACMRLFFGNWPAPTVYRDMTLAMRNLAAIDALRRVAEGATDKETIDEVSARRSILRLGLRTMFGDLRPNDDFRCAIGLSEEDLAVDFAGIGIETEQIYQKIVWVPMAACVLPIALSIPDNQKLASLHARCEEEFGTHPTLQILQKNPIDGACSTRLFATTI